MYEMYVLPSAELVQAKGAILTVAVHIDNDVMNVVADDVEVVLPLVVTVTVDVVE